MADVEPGKYRHYKGKTYEVIGTAVHSETLEELVVCKQIYDSERFRKGQLWVRPKIMFLENVIVDGRSVPRFSKINDLPLPPPQTPPSSPTIPSVRDIAWQARRRVLPRR